MPNIRLTEQFCFFRVGQLEFQIKVWADLQYRSHCQTAPLYRRKKPAKFGSEPAQFGRILKIAALTLDTVQDIMFFAQKCRKISRKIDKNVITRALNNSILNLFLKTLIGKSFPIR